MLTTDSNRVLPKLIVFEGVDGVGKTTLAEALAKHCRREFPGWVVAQGSLPGRSPNSLGEWVYRLHHGTIHGHSPESITPPALQLLHVAAHVDAVLSWIAPSLVDGCVILDRFWWSTYAYARNSLREDEAWPLVEAERPFWRPLPSPVIFYMTRSISLKKHEVDPQAHERLDRHYREIIERERSSGVEIYELSK